MAPVHHEDLFGGHAPIDHESPGLKPILVRKTIELNGF